MTREHKLALIVGFSLVLVLTVLVSDHFSKARQVAMDEKAAAAGTPVKVGVLPPGMRASADPAVDIRLIQDPTAGQPGLAPTTSPLAAAPQAPLASVNPEASRSAALPPGIIDPTAQTQGTQLAQATPGAGLPNTPLMSTGTNAAALSPDVRPLVPNSTIGAPMTTQIPGTIPVGPATTTTAPLPAGPAAPQMPMKRHEVREGDSAFGIARQHYGDGKLWEKLRDYNKDRLGKNGELREGVTLLLPPKDVLLGKPYQPEAAAATPTPVAPLKGAPAAPKTDPTKPVKPDTRVADAGETNKGFKEYTIQSGDTLGTVARKTLGSSKRWQEIADANPRVDPDALVVGAKIKIPAPR